MTGCVLPAPRCALRFWRSTALQAEVRVKGPCADALFLCSVGGQPVRHAGVPGGRARRADTGRRACLCPPWRNRPAPGSTLQQRSHEFTLRPGARAPREGAWRKRFTRIASVLMPGWAPWPWPFSSTWCCATALAVAFPASEELSRLLFVWMVFIGAAAAYPGRRAHGLHQPGGPAGAQAAGVSSCSRR